MGWGASSNISRKPDAPLFFIKNEKLETMSEENGSNAENSEKLQFTKVVNESGFPDWINRESAIEFIHRTMKPYHDSMEDISRALDYCFSEAEGKGGFLMLAHFSDQIAGQLTMLNSGMGGYIPENILLFVSIEPAMRGKRVGGKLIEYCLNEAEGDVKLHVEHDSPAKRLYERIGFTSKYAEMRYQK